MFLLYFLCFFSCSLSKRICFDDSKGEKCDQLNKNLQIKYIKYSSKELSDIFNESISSLNLAVFSKLDPINIPNNNVFNELKILSDSQEIELKTESQSLALKKLTVQDSTIKITTNHNNINIINITDTFERQNSHFLSSTNKKLRLIMNKCIFFNLLQDFDEFEIDTNQLKNKKFFIFPSIANDILNNQSITIISNISFLPSDFEFILYSSKSEVSLEINSKSYTFKNQNANYFRINALLPLTYIYNNSNLFDVYVQNDYCDFSNKKVNDFGLTFKIYSGSARFHSECSFYIDMDRSLTTNFLINCHFYNDSICEFNLDSPSSYLPLSIISETNLNIKVNHINSTILGYLFINKGNVTITPSITNKIDSDFHFYCSSIVNYSEKSINIHNERLFAYCDLTESEFFESIEHYKLTSFVILNGKVSLYPKFLINIRNIVGGTTIVDLISEESSGIDFIPQTNIKLKENGTVVIPYHVNFNETYEGVMEIHHARYNQLVEKGENRTFDLDDFYNSFKYYYLKYLCVFDNFTDVFIKTFNQFYPPILKNDQNTFNSNSIISIVKNHNNELNNFVRLFIKRDDSPINPFYDTKFRPLICNLSILNGDRLNENYEIEFSNSRVSELAKVSDFVLDGEVNFNTSSSCIEYRVTKPPTSSSEFFAYLVDSELISTANHIPFISVINPSNIDNFFNLLRNKESRNIVIVVCEGMKRKLNLTKIREDANVFIVGASVSHSSDLVNFFNTIRKGHELKSDLKKALDKISPKVPDIFPTVQIALKKVQSLTAIGVTIEKSLIECGSITFSLCAFKKQIFVSASNLITDLYSIQNLLDVTQNFRFLNVTLVPNFIGKHGGTTDLLSVTKIEFDENGWFFYSRGTIYDNATQDSITSEKVINKGLLNSPSYNFGLPYILAENEFFVYSITDNIEFSLIQSKIPPKALHFFSGERIGKKFLKEKISLLNADENIIEIPETTTLSFSGMWDMVTDSVGNFSFEFGNSNAIIQKVPKSMNIVFSGNKNISIDCNSRNQKIKDLSGSGPISVESNDGYVSFDSLSFKPFEKSFLNMNRREKILKISKIECQQHSQAFLNDISSSKIILNPDSSLEITNLQFERQSSIEFNFNYDYEMPLLVINDVHSNDNLKSIILNYSRNLHSQYKPLFDRYINKPRTFLKVENSKCSFYDNLFNYESDFADFNDQNNFNLNCIENNGFIEFSLKLISMPSLKLSTSEKVKIPDQIKEEPLVPPYLYIPPPSPTPKEHDMTAAIVGGSVGGAAFVGIISFVVYFIVSGKREDEALLDSLERKDARGEEVENLNEQTVESGIGVSVDESLVNSMSDEKKSESNEKLDDPVDNKDAEFKDEIEKP